MKKILIIFLTLLATYGFGQTWVEYKVDDNLTVKIPDNFQMNDTLGQHIIQARLTNALIMIQRIPNGGETVVQFSEDLTKAYEEFQTGILTSHKGKLKSQRWIENSRVQLNEFSYYATFGEEKQIRHCQVLFLNDYWYAIQFWEVESMTYELAADRELLYSSITLPKDVSRENQTSTGGPNRRNLGNATAYQAGYFGAMILGVNLIAGLIIWAFVTIKKIARKKKSA
jgi:hypothetical protein